MTKTRQATHCRNSSSSVTIVHSKLQEKPKKPKFTMIADEEVMPAMEKMQAYRHDEIQKIEREAVEIKELFEDLSQLVAEQKPTVDVIGSTLTSAQKHTEQADSHIKEAENKRCVIL